MRRPHNRELCLRPSLSNNLGGPLNNQYVQLPAEIQYWHGNTLKFTQPITIENRPETMPQYTR
jgi:hypothetical protein